MGVCLSGCAVGVEHNYSHAAPQFGSVPAGPFAVGVQDRRPYIISRAKDENFVGLSRGGWGNPFNVTTASGRPLADDFAAAIADGLRRNDASVTVIQLLPGLPPFQARQALVDTGAEKAVFLALNEWKADTYSTTGLIYDIELLILGADGTVLARATRKGKDDLGGSAWNPPAHSREAVPIAFRSKLEEIFSDADIHNQLVSSKSSGDG
jgi:hypothetical protein